MQNGCNVKSGDLILNGKSCDCLRTTDQEYYWNGTLCKPSLKYGSLCTIPNVHLLNQKSNQSLAFVGNMCQTSIQGTICNNTRGLFLCECPFRKYFDIESNTCKNQLTINSQCRFANHCQIVDGLTCTNRICR